MCRFALYLGDEINISSLVTEPTHSILHQSFQSREREEPLNGDGFGIAWYVEGSVEPALFKEINPAWSSINLNRIARVTRTRCLLAHVRAATPGLPVTQLNCHPFSWGPLTLMHNGRVGGFLRLKRELIGRLEQETYLEIEGSSDSEHVFALAKEAWDAGEGGDEMTRLESALRVAIQRVEALRRELAPEEPSLLNLALCDGRRAVVSRYTSDDKTPANSLYVIAGRRLVCEGGVCRTEEDGDGSGAAVVASEPLSVDPGWTPVPGNHLVRITDGLDVDIVPLF